jgi:transposase
VPLFQHRTEGGTTVSEVLQADLVVGVDTHLDTHAAAICDARGRVISQLQVPATTAGYAQLLAQVRPAAAGGQLIWAVEGTRHYGLGLARHLAGQGEQCGRDWLQPSRREAPGGQERPHRRRPRGPRAAGPPGTRADARRRDREALRLLMTGRDNAVQSCKTTRTALAAVLVTAPADLREQIRPLPRERRAKACAALTCSDGARW